MYESGGTRLLGHSESRESVHSSEYDEIQRVLVTDENVRSPAERVSARTSLLHFHRMSHVTKTAGDDHGLTVIGSKFLQSIHELRIHFASTGLFTSKFGLNEIFIIIPVNFSSHISLSGTNIYNLPSCHAFGRSSTGRV
jgi:hypothetical protein